MSSAWGQTHVGVLFAGAALLFLLDTALSIVLSAVSALNRVSLHRLAGELGPRFRYLEAMQEPQSTHRAATALLRQLCLLAGTLLITQAGREARLPYAGAIGLGLGVLVGVLLLEGLVARSLAVWSPRAALRRTAFLARWAHVLAYPLVRPLHGMLRRVERIQRVGEDGREEGQDEEVAAFIEVGEREGILEAEEGKMMRSIFDLDETRVREIMTPRTDIVALPLETTVADARRELLRAGHSRLPVYRETIDNVVGILHVRDLLRAWEERKDDQPVSRYLREAMFVPESISVSELLAEMRVRRHVAMVVDEYGGVAGLVTLEDLLEEIVGDIRDEHDPEEPLVRKEQGDSWVINAAAHVDELTELFGIEFEDRDFDTVGGLVVSRFGRVPVDGETVTVNHLQFEVLKADPRRIQHVRVRVGSASAARAPA